MPSRPTPPRRIPKDDQKAPTNHQDPKPFRLLSLPPELWLKISKHTIDCTPLLTFNNMWTLSHASPARRALGGLLQPAITQVCAALRVELLPYYYQTRIARIPWPLMERCVGRWLRAIGRVNRMHIGKVLTALSHEGGDRVCESVEAMLWERWDVLVRIEEVGGLVEGWRKIRRHEVRFL